MRFSPPTNASDKNTQMSLVITTRVPGILGRVPPQAPHFTQHGHILLQAAAHALSGKHFSR